MHLADSQQMVLDSEQQMRQYDRLVDSWTWQMHPLLHPKGYHHLVVCFVEVEGVAVGLEVHHLEGHQGCCDQSSMDHRPLEDGGKVLLSGLRLLIEGGTIFDFNLLCCMTIELVYIENRQ